MLGRGFGQGRGSGGEAGGHGRGQGGPLQSIIQSAVGVAAEYRAHRKEVEAAQGTTSPAIDRVVQSSSSDPSTTLNLTTPAPFDHGEEHDMFGNEEVWHLDEIAPPDYEELEAQQASTDDLVDEILRSDARDTMTEPFQPLAQPVVIPQRRPRSKKRGFVRAYAPVLEAAGIDQATFLKFLNNFHKASQANPVFPILQIAAGIAGMTPSLIAMGVCMGVQVAATLGAEVQSRQRTNTFLDRMNDELFKPHGLYAMIFKYKSKPGSEEVMQSQAMNLSTSKVIAKFTPSETTRKTMSERIRALRLSSGAAGLVPEAAPLIFPYVDHAVAKEGKETLKDRTRDAKKFLSEYLDRRAQIKHHASDPDSALNLPEDQLRMRSKRADPSHPMYSGGLISLLSGGALNDSMSSIQSNINPATSASPRGRSDSTRGNQREGGDHQEGFAIKNMLQEDVLYLLIVNMPSEAELAEARHLLDND